MNITGIHICTKCKNQFKWVYSVKERISDRMTVTVIDSHTTRAFSAFSKETGKNEIFVRCKNCNQIDIITDDLGNYDTDR